MEEGRSDFQVDPEVVDVPEVDSTKVEKYSEFLDELPIDREECLDMIERNFLDAARVSTLRFWQIGRIVSELEDRGEKDVIEDIMERTKYEKRTIQYTRSIYKNFPDFDYIKQVCGKGVEWSHFKEALRLKDEEDRFQLLDGISDGTIEKKDIKDKISEMNDKFGHTDTDDTGGTVEETEKVDIKMAKLAKNLGKIETSYSQATASLDADIMMFDLEETTKLDSEAAVEYLKDVRNLMTEMSGDMIIALEKVEQAIKDNRAEDDED